MIIAGKDTVKDIVTLPFKGTVSNMERITACSCR